MSSTRRLCTPASGEPGACPDPAGTPPRSRVAAAPVSHGRLTMVWPTVAGRGGVVGNHYSGTPDA